MFCEEALASQSTLRLQLEVVSPLGGFNNTSDILHYMCQPSYNALHLELDGRG